MLTVAVGAVMLIAPAGVAVAAPSGVDLQKRLEAVHEAGMPGAFAEVRDGRRVWTPTTGVADLNTGEPVRDGLRHRVGSITKTFVATTMLQLSGERRVNLDAPISRYLSKKLVPKEIGDKVTVRRLLNHTSGIGSYDTVLLRTEQDIIDLGRTNYTPEDLVRIGLSAAPTTGWSYSNTNYILAGLIIQKVTGHSYRTEVSRRILKPLHLTDTYFEGANPDIRGPHMQAYVPWPLPLGEPRDFTHYNMSWAWAAGEIVSTAHDLNVFYRALLSGRLLTPSLLAQMKTTVPEDPANPDLTGYGLGLYWVQLPGGKAWGHDGGTIGHVTVSWHSEDGTRQVTYAQSMSFYRTSLTEAHPIDIASTRFFVAALDYAGPQAARTASPLDLTRHLTR